MKLLAEVLAVLCTVGGARWWVGRDGDRDRVRTVTGLVLAVIALGAAIADLHGAGSALNESRKHAVSAEAGRQACLTEPGTGPVMPERTRFIQWVKDRLPRGASYALAPYSGPPDLSCVTLVLLPAVPTGPGAPARWTLTMGGTVPPAIASLVARHDPSIQVFAPGFVLARTASR